ncbi:DUF1304 domain-containing protein [Pyxidicoccus xibeiensis]|uniref:DUF1304 domain-containing protein n=1 Tax=Pyxidicoccus xibeiensis TaxID=2906759 RepID=UPI0020A742BD|nr:DUF1304 domain-containing protein [Pyxidicoccus xibeiensis]MCP3140132.1 DUF1304 domain-containing protein [Pyxidicoccus xibeiensis]
MRLPTRLLVGFVALQHFGFLVLEAFFWTSEFGRKTFATTPEFAEASKVLAANQGLYNGFLAAALVMGLLAKDKHVARATLTFTLACVVVAGIVGGITAKPSILLVQGLPALMALVLVRRDRTA